MKNQSFKTQLGQDWKFIHDTLSGYANTPCKISIKLRTLILNSGRTSFIRVLVDKPLKELPEGFSANISIYRNEVCSSPVETLQSQLNPRPFKTETIEEFDSGIKKENSISKLDPKNYPLEIYHSSFSGDVLSHFANSEIVSSSSFKLPLKLPPCEYSVEAKNFVSQSENIEHLLVVKIFRTNDQELCYFNIPVFIFKPQISSFLGLSGRELVHSSQVWFPEINECPIMTSMAVSKLDFVSLAGILGFTSSRETPKTKDHRLDSSSDVSIGEKPSASQSIESIEAKADPQERCAQSTQGGSYVRPQQTPDVKKSDPHIDGNGLDSVKHSVYDPHHNIDSGPTAPIADPSNSVNGPDGNIPSLTSHHLKSPAAPPDLSFSLGTEYPSQYPVSSGGRVNSNQQYPLAFPPPADFPVNLAHHPVNYSYHLQRNLNYIPPYQFSSPLSVSPNLYAPIPNNHYPFHINQLKTSGYKDSPPRTNNVNFRSPLTTSYQYPSNYIDSYNLPNFHQSSPYYNYISSDLNAYQDAKTISHIQPNLLQRPQPSHYQDSFDSYGFNWRYGKIQKSDTKNLQQNLTLLNQLSGISKTLINLEKKTSPIIKDGLLSHVKPPNRFTRPSILNPRNEAYQESPSFYSAFTFDQKSNHDSLSTHVKYGNCDPIVAPPDPVSHSKRSTINNIPGYLINENRLQMLAKASLDSENAKKYVDVVSFSRDPSSRKAPYQSFNSNQPHFPAQNFNKPLPSKPSKNINSLSFKKSIFSNNLVESNSNQESISNTKPMSKSDSLFSGISSYTTESNLNFSNNDYLTDNLSKSLFIPSEIPAVENSSSSSVISRAYSPDFNSNPSNSFSPAQSTQFILQFTPKSTYTRSRLKKIPHLKPKKMVSDSKSHLYIYKNGDRSRKSHNLDASLSKDNSRSSIKDYSSSAIKLLFSQKNPSKKSKKPPSSEFKEGNVSFSRSRSTRDSLYSSFSQSFEFDNQFTNISTNESISKQKNKVTGSSVLNFANSLPFPINHPKRAILKKSIKSLHSYSGKPISKLNPHSPKNLNGSSFFFILEEHNHSNDAPGALMSNGKNKTTSKDIESLGTQSLHCSLDSIDPISPSKNLSHETIQKLRKKTAGSLPRKPVLKSITPEKRIYRKNSMDIVTTLKNTEEPFITHKKSSKTVQPNTNTFNSDYFPSIHKKKSFKNFVEKILGTKNSKKEIKPGELIQNIFPNTKSEFLLTQHRNSSSNNCPEKAISNFGSKKFFFELKSNKIIDKSTIINPKSYISGSTSTHNLPYISKNKITPSRSFSIPINRTDEYFEDLFRNTQNSQNKQIKLLDEHQNLISQKKGDFNSNFEVKLPTGREIEYENSYPLNKIFTIENTFRKNGIVRTYSGSNISFSNEYFFQNEDFFNLDALKTQLTSTNPNPNPNSSDSQFNQIGDLNFKEDGLNTTFYTPEVIKDDNNPFYEDLPIKLYGNFNRSSIKYPRSIDDPENPSFYHSHITSNNNHNSSNADDSYCHSLRLKDHSKYGKSIFEHKTKGYNIVTEASNPVGLSYLGDESSNTTFSHSEKELIRRYLKNFRFDNLSRPSTYLKHLHETQNSGNMSPILSNFGPSHFLADISNSKSVDKNIVLIHTNQSTFDLPSLHNSSVPLAYDGFASVNADFKNFNYPLDNLPERALNYVRSQKLLKSAKLSDSESFIGLDEVNDKSEGSREFRAFLRIPEKPVGKISKVCVNPIKIHRTLS
ncbi:hypothetical protein AYI68_g1090 [Smittium mucronatum]|uniref:Uncharacterized protein n=1 Tax=Smittium mucronatum TaxID=133383 RepID=A0A1R0H6G7_9FUNG|nr:hypothetical protein AYI68_g1090 [Smittium mucronatum]